MAFDGSSYVIARRFALTLLVVLFPLLGARAQEPAAADPFPRSESMREGVEFWKNVWTKWSLQQVVLHDTDHPSLVYEVFELPPPAGDVYTDAQREYVKGRREALQIRLAIVETKVTEGIPLDDDEKALVLKITDAAGSDGLTGASTRVRSQRGLRERFRRGLEIAGRYHDAFVRVFREAGLPEGLADLPHVESSFQAEARSSAGAVGVWQFTRSAARKFLLMTAGLDERLDPVAAARGAARYLKQAYDELGSWPMAITAYNHGVEGMRAARDRFGVDFDRILSEYDGRTFGFASKNFYKEFLAARDVAGDHASFFPEGVAPEAPLARDRVRLEKPTPAATIAARYHLTVGGLAGINPAWTARALRGSAPLPAGTEVWLPAGTLEHVAGLGKRHPATAKTPTTDGTRGRSSVHQ